MNGSRTRAALLREVYREIVITLATVFAVSKLLPEELICEVDRRLRALYRRQCTRYADVPPDPRPADGAIRPHPKLVQFLDELRDVS